MATGASAQVFSKKTSAGPHDKKRSVFVSIGSEMNIAEQPFSKRIIVPYLV